MSNFKPQEVNNLMELITDWVKMNFVVNAEKYGIEGNYPEYDRIGHIVLNSFFTVFTSMRSFLCWMIKSD